MIIDDKHIVSIYVSGKLLELENSSSSNIRLNETIFNPTKSQTTQASYSFSFSIPSTPKNNEILGFANVLPHDGKFLARYNCEVYADETLIFKGSLSISEFDHDKQQYKANLISFKVNDLDEIFDDAVLSDIPWYVDFQGASTINAVNADNTSKYYFPFVSYGVFQKKPYLTDEVGNEYTSKFNIDMYNRFWVESFYPSMNVMETIKKALEWKGYSVGGTAFQDRVTSGLFASCNLSSEQIPTYNLGNPRFGKVVIGGQWSNATSADTSLYQDLDYPYEKIGFSTADLQYNFKGIDVWNMWSTMNMTNFSEQYLFDPGENCVVVPADGWYRIRLIVSAELSGYGTTFTAQQYRTSGAASEYTVENTTITRNLSGQTPLEIQLVRNYDENIELIKGKKNVRYMNGNPNDEYYGQDGTRTTLNKVEWYTEYPHQKLYDSENPTKGNEATAKAIGSTSTTDSQGRTGGRVSSDNTSIGGGTRTRTRRRPGQTEHTIGYMHKDGNNVVMPYDQNVSEAFICGFSSIGDGTVAVMKNGKSWYKGNAIKNKVLANVTGLDFVTRSGTTLSYEDTSMNYNTYPESPSNVCNSTFGTYMSGQVHLCVYLKKNDVLELMAIQRDFDGQKYACTASTYFEMEAVSPIIGEEKLRSTGYNYYTPTAFPYELNLSNFMNNEMRIADWIKQVCDTLNIEIVQDGKNVDFNVRRGVKKDGMAYISIDDRVSDREAVSSRIDYPARLGARWTVNVDEYGYETTVPSEWINETDWADHGDKGYEIVQLDSDPYNTSSDVMDSRFSYCWYVPFNLMQEGTSGTQLTTLNLPVIELSEYMADGYGYDEAMKHDGMSLTQRFWFRQSPTQYTRQLASWMDENVYLDIPTPLLDDVMMSYKYTEKSLLTELFNVYPRLSSNYVTVNVYLTPQEYMLLKAGTKVKFNDDILICCSISGFDPSGLNPTKIQMMKQ